MAGKNQVTLTFAGDPTDLEKSFDRVGDAAKNMDDDVKKAGDGFDKMGEATDTLDTRAMGFRDTVTGVQDSVKGFGQILKGDLSADALVTAGMGVGDLASGFTNLLVPSLKNAVSWLGKTKVGMLAQAAASKVVAAATKIWTGIQAAFNLVMSLNPVALIVIAIVALVAALVIAYKKSETFRDIVNGVFEAVGKVVKTWWEKMVKPYFRLLRKGFELIVRGAKLWWQGVKKYFGFWKAIIETLVGWVTGLKDRIVGRFNAVVDFVRKLPGRIRKAASGMWNGIRDSFKSALNWIIDRWNGLSFTLPSISVFGQTVGGMTLSTPNIPRFHTGGIASGAMGREFLAVLRAGEKVTPTGGQQQATRMTVEAGDRGSSVEQAISGLVLHLVRTGALRLVVRNDRVAVA